jgi:predicted transcriptional regulator
MQRERRVRDSFNLRKDTSARAERLARRTGTSRSSIDRAAIEEYLELHEQAAITAAINAVLAQESQDLSFVEGTRQALVDSGLVGEWNE